MSDTTTEPEKTPLDLDTFLCFAVYSAGHAFNQIYRPLLDALDLTYPQYLVMVTLWQQDDVTVKDIGRTLFLESSTLTPLLKRLEGLGYITRTRDPVDERQVRVRLTDTGKALKATAKSIPPCIGTATGLSPETLQRLITDLSATRDSILAAAE
ncbi:MarR family transcriptional regulator [Ciceribacter sp. L1K22]|uniref:MarR family winged helix-turn-helix transcriptional regulator n=1 Tax=Ciceribacter sp. L1K22 TaxID=2820275 RepID=UPI001ABDDB4C|nr:MarR family transcriptional regulator [Ciceribacter sp. L1K22]MBO3758894.1 MarR family transcriptional regulator [Ciceribacter sp. L1K22]